MRQPIVKNVRSKTKAKRPRTWRPRPIKAKDFIKCPRGASRPRPWPRGLHHWFIVKQCVQLQAKRTNALPDDNVVVLRWNAELFSNVQFYTKCAVLIAKCAVQFYITAKFINYVFFFLAMVKNSLPEMNNSKYFILICLNQNPHIAGFKGETVADQAAASAPAGKISDSQVVRSNRKYLFTSSAYCNSLQQAEITAWSIVPTGHYPVRNCFLVSNKLQLYPPVKTNEQCISWWRYSVKRTSMAWTFTTYVFGPITKIGLFKEFV